MRRSRFAVEQIVAVLKQAELGVPTHRASTQQPVLSQSQRPLERTWPEHGVDRQRAHPVWFPACARHAKARGMASRPKPGQAWAMDFVADEFGNGGKFRMLTVVDVFTREALTVDAGLWLRGENVVETLNRLVYRDGAGMTISRDHTVLQTT